MNNTLILLRTHDFSAQAAALARRLAAETPYHVAILADESKTPVACDPFDKVVFTASGCAALGLYYPADAGWRCGDYGFYLARRQWPAADTVWMIEYDVRINFDRLADFFAIFAHDPTDVLLCQFRPAQPDWYWYHAMRMRRRNVYRCLFPVVRLSAEAIDRLRLARKTYAESAVFRLEWPNDEAFVATEAMALGLSCNDLNHGGRAVYTDASLSFHHPVDGDALDRMEADSLLYHPVLYGDALGAKRNKLAVQARPDKLRARLTRRAMRLAWT